ncbi:Disks large 5 [Dermatophagoides pteronyssinus]|uniref:Disks large 5 n=1 Tax=Dermatophagoides pteronyssinus TaxID=6956 RepID=A0ABQ8J646_DERPT|nr:Disks large 5 [Dermatophagoides pteronyssinus]
MDLSVIDKFIDDDDDDLDYQDQDYIADVNNNDQTIINYQSQLLSDEQQTFELKNLIKFDEQQQQQYKFFTNRILILQQTCQNLIQRINTLQTECDHYCRQSRTYHFLFIQEKHVRQRLSRLLTSSQRELEHHKRFCCPNTNINLNENLYQQKSLSLNKTRKKRQKIRTTLSSQSTNNCNYQIEHDEKQKQLESFSQSNISGYKNFDYDQKEDLNNNSNQELLKKKSNLICYNSMRECIKFSKSLLNLNDVNNNTFDMNKNNNDIQSIDNMIKYESDIEQVKQLTMTKKLHEFHGIFFDTTIENGVIIRQVANNSEARKAGLRQGDRILELCGINMRMANYRLAEKIINECKDNEIIIKINCSVNRYESDISLAMAKSSINNYNRKLIKKQSTLVRRNAFKRKNRILHRYFERKQNEHSALYQNYLLNVSLPRRIHLRPLFANKLKLCGGNAVGIFVHTIAEELQRFLQIGDQLLEYNKYDLTQATAEDAALHLAEPIAQNTAELIVLFNIDVFHQIQENPIGDSFYIRAEFERSSACNSSLKFNKGDILYVDNTLYDGKPCQYWRAWKLDPFGQPIESGYIPSKYNAECEVFRQFFRNMNNHDTNMLHSIRHIFHRLISNKSNVDDNDTRLLASFSSMSNDRNGYYDNQNSLESMDNIDLQAYRRVRMIEQTKPRPVIIFGPYSHTIVKRLESQFSSLFRLCQKKTETMIMMSSIWNEKKDDHYISCSSREDGESNFISLTELTEISNQGLHPVITITGNSLDEFHQQQIYPIIIELRFRSAKQMKIAVNKYWNHTSKISLRTAKNIHKHHQKLSKQFEHIEHVILNANINLMNIINMIEFHVLIEQDKLIWKEA